MNLQGPLSQEIEERPEGYIGPDLNPAGLKLEPQELVEGIYALLANIPPKDNNGVIIGDSQISSLTTLWQLIWET